MRTYLRKSAVAAVVAMGLAAAGPVAAHEAGGWLVKVGVTHVKPKSDNGNVLDGAVGIDVGNSTRPSFSVTLLATPNVVTDSDAPGRYKDHTDAVGRLQIALSGHLANTPSL